MQRIAVILIVLLSLALDSCGTLGTGIDKTPTINSTGNNGASSQIAPLLSMESTSVEIQNAMLMSATHWQTIWMDGTTTEYANGAPMQTTREQVWIEQTTPRFRVLVSGPNSNTALTFKASDGLSILDLNLVTGQSTSIPIPDGLRVGQYVPPLQAGVANANPIWGQIGTSVSEMAFTSNFAQNEGTFKATAVETIAGREALSVEWTYIQNNLPSWKLWLDRETAVILKMQFFQKSGGEPLMNERVVNQVVYNTVFDAALFVPPSVSPQFGDVTGTAANVNATESVVPSERDPLGELYFFILPHQPGLSVQLVHLPGSCVVGVAQCPQLETVSVPFQFNFNLSALSWSPDGRIAAFAYPDNANGTPTKLFLYDPAAFAWTSLAEFPYIDPPFWSPDGTWIAFRVQDGQGGEDVYAVHRDGTSLKNLTASGVLPIDGRPYVMDGWLTENIIVRSALPAKQGGVYLLRVSDGKVRSMFNTLLTKSAFVVSPDGSWLAYDDYDYNSQKHTIKVVEPDGANPLDLISFTGGSVNTLIWSPDGTRLAFTHSTTDAKFNPISDVYVIGRDGRGMTQVYKGSTVGNILFSPDGLYLLVDETTTATGGHLFVVNLETLEQRILSAPGLSLDTDWYAPSWKR